MNLFLLIISAYLIGSIPTAYWIGKFFFNIDIREHGSKNMGASNTFRVLGSVWGIIVLVIDMGKGIAAVQLAHAVQSSDWLSGEQTFWKLIFGLVAVAGHIFPVFAGFRGGKGVATLFGVVLAIQPWTALISIGAFLIVVFLTKYISLGSVIAVIVFAACVWFAVKETNVYMRWFSVIAALLVIVMHRSNIKRLIAGTENKFKGLRKKK
ncbi:glycerol-3-phosphate 1-O-acyltransferase PlsY [Lacibacter sediminis]|uniref:Glycerol-3-phosphate acyltransferase n=1 Tax=Lacibacter sediminis TaxID=2760713 RepID=A0A7G5XCL4_9BACT|nr:glycerol-3-phosphate 1-O-acyltransferase PlsY [Lacibacter sediminis]QNA43217.1 glycerol-3-phosphate 1-O-acyltransferase PlsY [Lacibacter sediminis]